MLNYELKALWLEYVKAGLTGKNKKRVGWEVFAYDNGERVEDYSKPDSVMVMILDHEKRRVFKCLLYYDKLLLLGRSLWDQRKILNADPDCFTKFKKMVDDRLEEMKTVPNHRDSYDRSVMGLI